MLENERWTEKSVLMLFEKPFFDVVHRAYVQHQQYHDNRAMELCVLSSIKTGSCPEDCAYCPQSAHYKTEVSKEKLLPVEPIVQQAKRAKQLGAKRLCLGGAWRAPPKKEFDQLLTMVTAVKQVGLEVCATFGLLNLQQATALKAAGLDYYNHNLDTSPRYYRTIITTRTYQDRIETIKYVTQAGLQLCCGGIIGMGENRLDRVQWLLALKELPTPPNSIPINQLIPIPGTPLANASKIDPFEFIKTIAITRILFPTAVIRLSAGRETMSDEMQAWCFMAGANSLFIGDKLLTANNACFENDKNLLETLNLTTHLTSRRDQDHGE